MSPDFWVPGAAEPSLDDFVARVHRAIEGYTSTHAADQTHVEVELGDGERLTLKSLSSEPGYVFLTLILAEEQLIVPVASPFPSTPKRPDAKTREAVLAEGGRTQKRSEARRRGLAP